MKKRSLTSVATGLLLALAVLAAGCGQKGPLMLPASAASAPAATK